MAKNNEVKYKIGEFLIEKDIIDKSQLSEALDLQQHNKERLLGEILVTMGHISKEKLIMSLEMYMVMTDSENIAVNEWLDQDEIDIIIKKLESSMPKKS